MAKRAQTTADVDEVVAYPNLFVAPKNPQARLDGLPDELALAVLKLLSVAALAQLCRTSKRYNRIATECLYGCVDGTDLSRQDCGAMETIGNINPVLGKHIKKLSLCLIEDAQLDDDEQEWYHGGRELFTRVLGTAINVKTLAIADNLNMGSDRQNIAQEHGWIQVFNKAHLHTVDRLGNPFQHLTDIIIYTNCGLGFEDIASIFRLPAIESMALAKITETAPMKNWRVPKSSSRVKRLRLEGAFVDSTAVAQVLNSLKTLVKFEYTHDADNYRLGGPEEDPRSHLAELSWIKILEALKEHRKSLTSLSLRELGEFTEPSFNDNDNGKIGSLTDFAKLEELSLDVEILLNMAAGEIDLAKQLPKGLQRVTIDIWPKIELSDLYGPIIKSLQDGVFNQEKKQLYITCQMSMEIGLADMALSGPIEALSHAGIETRLSGNGKPGYSSHKLDWSVEDLRELEAAEASDGSRAATTHDEDEDDETETEDLDQNFENAPVDELSPDPAL